MRSVLAAVWSRSPSPRGRGRDRVAGRDRELGNPRNCGQAAVEWSGLLILVALLITALLALTPRLPDQLAQSITCSIGKIFGEGCGGPPAPAGPPATLTLDGTPFRYDPEFNAYLPPGVTPTQMKYVGPPTGDLLVGSRSPAVPAALGRSALDELPPGTNIVLPPPPCHTACQIVGNLALTLLPALGEIADAAAAARAAEEAAQVVEDTSAELAPYREGGGHHIPAKSAFRGAPGYDPAEALAIPNAELDRLGISHAAITGAQSTLYRQFAATGQTLTWSDTAQIETLALVSAGMKPGMAASTVEEAIAALRASGVESPTRIPWGG